MIITNEHARAMEGATKGMKRVFEQEASDTLGGTIVIIGGITDNIKVQLRLYV